MYRTILCAAAALFIANQAAMPAKADETLKFRAVQHATSVQNMVEANGHSISLGRTVGMTFSPDGSSTGTVLIIGTSDIVVGSEGTVSGYSIPTFTDGSELWLKYTGTVKFIGGPTGKVAIKGTLIVTGGKGRYAGATGDGTWEGEATQSQATVAQPSESIAYVDNVINVKR
jgi:hypothetical protein